jgi:hypothetical protein
MHLDVLLARAIAEEARLPQDPEQGVSGAQGASANRRFDGPGRGGGGEMGQERWGSFGLGEVRVNGVGGGGLGDRSRGKVPLWGAGGGEL